MNDPSHSKEINNTCVHWSDQISVSFCNHRILVRAVLCLTIKKNVTSFVKSCHRVQICAKKKTCGTILNRHLVVSLKNFHGFCCTDTEGARELLVHAAGRRKSQRIVIWKMYRSEYRGWSNVVLKKWKLHTILKSLNTDWPLSNNFTNYIVERIKILQNKR